MHIKRLFYIFIILLIPFTVGATDYYFAQSYAGNGSGSSYANRMSVSSLNAITGDKGGNNYYGSGTITTQIKPQMYGSGGSYVTIDGYEGGDCDPVGNLEVRTGYHTGAGNAAPRKADTG